MNLKLANSVLFLVVVAELAGVGVLAAGRLNRPQPPPLLYAPLDPRTADALRVLREKAADGSYRDWRNLAEGCLSNGFYAEAEQCFETAVELNSGDLLSLYGWGFCLERTGRMKEAISVLEKAAAAAGEELRMTCHYQIGRNYLRLEDAKNAEKAFREIPAFPPAAWQLAKLMVRTDRADEAIPLIEQQLRSMPDSMKLLHLRGRAAEIVGDKETAALCKDLLKRSRSELKLEYGVEYINTLRSKYGLSSDLAKCARLKSYARPQEALPVFNEMLDYIRLNDLFELRNVFLSAAELELELNHPDSAIELIEEIHSQTYETPDSIELLGDAFHLAGRDEEAFATWERVARLRPRALLYVKISDYYKRRGDQEQENKYFGLAAHQSGLLAFRGNRLDAALKEFEKALELNPENAQSWFYVGETQRALGRNTAAKTAYEKCLELNPNHGRAADALLLLTSSRRESGNRIRPVAEFAKNSVAANRFSNGLSGCEG